MKNRNYSFLLLISCWLVGFPLSDSFGQRRHYQHADVDFEAWLGGTYQLKIDKRWDLKLTSQARTQYEFGEAFELNNFLVQAETTYDPRFAKWAKPLEISLAARYIGANKKNYENYIRFHLDLSYSVEWKRLEATYRFRFQLRDQIQARSSVDPVYWSKGLRNLLRLKYNIKKWKLDPEIWGELFYRDELGSLNGFSDFRVGIRTTYDIDKHHSLGFRYFIEREIRYFNPETTHIVGVFYKYKMDWKKKKAKKK